MLPLLLALLSLALLPLAGQDGLRQAVLAYAGTSEATLELDRDRRGRRLTQAHRTFRRAQAEYQAWWGFQDDLAWATAVRAGG